MKIFSLIIPKFLKTLDNYFLLNYRLLWITKIHYAIYFSVFAALGGSALIWAYPLSTDSSIIPSVEVVMFFSILAVLPIAVFWVYKQVIFNIEKNYGQLFPLMEYIRFGSYLFVFGMLVGLPILFSSLIESKVKNLATPQELVQDVYDLNMGNPYFPTQRHGDILWEEDKKVIMENYQNEDIYSLPNLSDGRNYYNFRPFYVNIYIERENYAYENTDDAKKVRNTFLETSYDATKLTYIKNYLRAYNKYSAIKIKLSPEEILQLYKSHTLHSEIFGIGKDEINAKLYEISAMHDRPMNTRDIGIAAICVVFSLSTLLLIFQNVRWLDFVLAAISFGVGGFLLLGTLAFIDSLFIQSYDNSIILVAILCCFAFFFGKSLQINGIKTFSRFKIFSLMFANVMSPYLLLLVAAVLSKSFHYPNSYITGAESQFWILAGFVLHTLLFVPIYKKLYLKMRALPKN